MLSFRKIDIHTTSVTIAQLLLKVKNQKYLISFKLGVLF